jgi:predicted nucleic acid-binding protein
MVMVALLDSTVLIDFVGSSVPERHAASHVINAAANQRFEGVVALQTVQEILHARRLRGVDIQSALTYARWVGESFRVLSHEADDATVMLDILGEHSSLGSADAMIYACGLRGDVDLIVTRDKTLGRVVGEAWIDPMDPDSLGRLIGS